MSVSGIVVSSGIAFGQALHLQQHDNTLDYRLLPLFEVPAQQQKLTLALNKLKNSLHTGLAHLSDDSENYQLIEADLLLLEDDDLINQMLESISRLQFSASVTVERFFAHQASELEALEDPYLANRAQDVRCLGKRLIATINGAIDWDLSKLNQPTILLASDLTPAEFAILPLAHIKGIVLETGGLTSHTAILAKAAGIPALLSCPFKQEQISNGQALVLDAIEGVLHSKLTPELTQTLIAKQEVESLRRQQLLSFKDRDTCTIDGHKVTLMANVGNLNDVTHMTDVGAQGIGLFRTEFMLINAISIPDEKTQYNLYCDALHSLNGQTLTLRTLDIGADKEVPCLCQAPEDNPALGLRGIRYTLANPHLFKTQLRAVLRAANHGCVRLMFPMVNQIEELEQVFAVIETCKSELTEEEKGYGNLQYGIVVETPAAVMNLSTMLPYLDFISIGTNDLTQYAMAVDRTNPILSRDYPSMSPAILTLIKMAIDQAKAANVSVSLCGELASDPTNAPLLVGLGLDEMSVNLTSLLEVKSVICSGQYRDFVTFANKALTFNRLKDLHEYISHYK